MPQFGIIHLFSQPFHLIAQSSDSRDLDLTDIAINHVVRNPFRAHPHHVARIKGAVLRHADEEFCDAEDHGRRLECDLFFAVNPHSRHRCFQIQVRFDPWPHRCKCVRILATPHGPVAALPGAFGYVIADGVAKDAIPDGFFCQILHFLRR